MAMTSSERSRAYRARLAGGVATRCNDDATMMLHALAERQMEQIDRLLSVVEKQAEALANMQISYRCNDDATMMQRVATAKNDENEPNGRDFEEKPVPLVATIDATRCNEGGKGGNIDINIKSYTDISNIYLLELDNSRVRADRSNILTYPPLTPPLPHGSPSLSPQKIQKNPETLQRVATPPAKPKRQREAKASNYTSEFEAAWQAYDRKGNKAEAAKQWHLLTPEQQAQAVASIEPYFAAREQRQYRKDFERYLSSGTYEAKHEPPQAAKALPAPEPAPRRIDLMAQKANDKWYDILARQAPQALPESEQWRVEKINLEKQNASLSLPEPLPNTTNEQASIPTTPGTGVRQGGNVGYQSVGELLRTSGYQTGASHVAAAAV